MGHKTNLESLQKLKPKTAQSRELPSSCFMRHCSKGKNESIIKCFMEPFLIITGAFI